MSYRRICFASLLLAAACGGISDPSHSNGPAPTTVTGTLKGANGTEVPVNARLAVVWRKAQNGFAVGADVPIQNGAFQLSLAAPPNDYFFSPEGTSVKVSESTDPAPSVSGTPGNTSSGPGDVKPLSDGTIGGSVAGEMTVAMAGFVVYRDANGNGQLDLDGSNITSNDEVIGGNHELAISYLRGGGTLDYEKLRDRSGILPKAGFNLFWSEGRWLPLDLVELKIDSSIRMASAVCAGEGYDDVVFNGGGVDSTEPATPTSELPPSPKGYPDPSEVNCNADGSWTYKTPPECYSPPPPPPGICRGGGDEPAIACARPNGALPPASPVPDGWPCGDAGTELPPPVRDGGSADVDVSLPDSGIADAGKAD